MTAADVVAVPGFRRALSLRGFRWLLLSHGMGTVAQGVLTLAVGVHVLAETTSGLWVSVSVALSFAPYALVSSLAGVVADRCSRSRVLACSCAVRALLAGAVAAAMGLGWPVPVVVLLAALVGLAATPSYPALAAATPQCVSDPALPAANALVTCVENATWIAGPGVFGMLMLLDVPVGDVVMVCAGCFAHAAVVAGQVRLAPVAPRSGVAWWADLRLGVALVARRRAVRGPMLLAMADNFLYGYLVVALVLLVHGSGSGDGRLGALNAALATGALGSMAVVTRLTSRDRAPQVLPVTLVVFGGCLVALGLVGAGSVLAIGLAGLAGATTLVTEVAAVTLLQRAADASAMARVFGVYDQLNVGAIALGSLLAGPLAALLGPGAATALVAGAGVLLALPTVVGAVRPRALGFSPCPDTSSSSPQSTSRVVAPSSSSRVLPAQRRPSETPSLLP